MLTIRFRAIIGTNAVLKYRVDLDSLPISNVHAAFMLSYDQATWRLIWQALAPGFVLDQAEMATRSVVESLGGPTRLLQTIGEVLSQALVAVTPKVTRMRIALRSFSCIGYTFHRVVIADLRGVIFPWTTGAAIG